MPLPRYSSFLFPFFFFFSFFPQTKKTENFFSLFFSDKRPVFADFGTNEVVMLEENEHGFQNLGYSERYYFFIIIIFKSFVSACCLTNKELP